MTDVTRILNAIEQGDAKAADELLPLAYEELRILSAQKLPENDLATHFYEKYFAVLVHHIPQKCMFKIINSEESKESDYGES